MARIEGVQRKIAQCPHSHLLKLEFELRAELDVVLNQLEILWWQKSWMESIRDGGRNTRYYHLSTIIRHRANKIEALKDMEGNWFGEASVVKGMVRDFFVDLY